MFMDLVEMGSGEVSCDLAIIGGGVAGIVLADQLKDSGLDIIVLEGGGLEAGPGQELYRADTRIFDSGDLLLRDDPGYLIQSRLRFFGGTSNHWSNWCRPFDPIDFQERAWVPHSGWPITRDELEPYYQRAYGVCGVDPVTDEAIGDRYTFSKGSSFRSALYHIRPQPVLFGQVYREALDKASGVRVFLHANVVEMKSGPSGDRLERVRARSLAGDDLVVSARAFVLACGGIENPRLLLNADDSLPNGLANSSGTVGRFFSEDLHFTLGEFSLDDFPPHLIAEYNALVRKPSVLVVRVDEEVQRTQGLLNFQIDLDPLPIGKNDSVARAVGSLYSSQPGAEPHQGELRFICGNAPDPRNRVALTSERDALGLRKAKLDVHLSELERATFEKAMEMLIREVGIAGSGRIRRYLAKGEAFDHASFERAFRYYGYHHNGTTRMSADPTQGVVDQNCRAHDLENLYIAGSSVFTISGHAPPTLTIVALALRLAEQLESIYG